jgi:hypothetical protein
VSHRSFDPPLPFHNIPEAVLPAINISQVQHAEATQRIVQSLVSVSKQLKYFKFLNKGNADNGEFIYLDTTFFVITTA